MNNFSRDIISDIHQLVSKAKAFENQLRPLAELYTQVQGMTEQLEDLNAKVLDIENNINKGGIEADDLRQILRNAFAYIPESKLLRFDVNMNSVTESFRSNAVDDIEIIDQTFEIQSGCEVYLSDYDLCMSSVNWDVIADDIRFDVDFSEDAIEGFIDRVIDKACLKSDDVPSEAMEGNSDD